MDIMKQINNLPEELQNIIFLYIHNPMKKEIEYQPIKEGVKNIHKSFITGKFRIYNSYRLYRTLNEEELIKYRKYIGRVVREEKRWEAPRIPPFVRYLTINLNRDEHRKIFQNMYKAIPKKIITLIRKEYGIRGRYDADYEKIYKLYHYKYYD